MKHYYLIAAMLFFCGVLLSFGQETKEEPPAFKTNRADENYEYLRDAEENPYEAGFLDAIKFVKLTDDGSSYASFGGQLRPRIEHFTNRDWLDENDTYYAQRFSLYGDFHFGEKARLFVELANGLKTGEKEITQSDDLGLHQAFAEFKFQLGASSQMNVRFGRQELNLGASRLVSDRAGPNIRRSFDVLKIAQQFGNTTLMGFYGKEVSPQFNVFDNEFALFDSNAANPELWTLGLEFPIKNIGGSNQLYYLGFKVDQAAYSDVFGEEVRHTIGLRRYGTIGQRISYNTELVYQFGTLGNNDISAFNLETDWKYTLINTKWRPILGLKLDLSSGDRNLDDGTLNTFNPLFVNPGLYSLAAINTPANLTSFHPNMMVFPFQNFSIYADYAKFYRTSTNDGVYVPTRFQSRQASGLDAKHLGDAFGLKLTYEINRNLSFDIKSYYFITGEFIEQSGSSENTFHIAPTLEFTF